MNFCRPMLAKASSSARKPSHLTSKIQSSLEKDLAYVGSRFSLKSQNDYEFKYEFPEIVELKHLTKTVVLDGELIIMKEGMPDFEAMQRRSKEIRWNQIPPLF